MSNGNKNQKKADPVAETPAQSTAMTTTGPTAIAATGGVPVLTERPQQDDLSEYADHLGEGHEDRRQVDNRIPMLYLLQPQSPRVKDRTKLERAEAGMLFDTAADRLYDISREPILVLPIAQKVTYVEWIPRNKDGSGGGFISRYDHNDPRIAEVVANPEWKFKKIPYQKGVDGKCEDAKGTELVETIELYGAFVLPDAWVPWVFPLTGLKIGDWRKWYNVAFPGGTNDGRMPAYSQLALMSSYSNPKKSDAWSIKMEPAYGTRQASRLRAADARFQYGAEMYQGLFGKNATLKVDHAAAYEQQAAQGGDGSVDIPF